MDDQIECSLLVEAAEADLADPIAAAHWARSRLGLRQDEPVRDLCGLLESRGIKVLLFDIQSDGFFGLSVSAADLGGPAVVVNTWQDLSVERQIFTAAHELGHLLLHRDDYDGGGEVRDEEEVSEREADLFAAHFLMPDEVFAKEWEATRGLDPVDRILKVKRMFRVSYKTVLRRLADRQPDPELRQQIWPYFFKRWRQRYQHSLGKRDEPFAVRLKEFKAGASETWRREEKETLSPVDFQEDRLPSLVRQAVETGEISISRGAEILGRDLEDMKSLAASWTL
ncbi:MAG: ImmA/IrrE family metallo-endopeptidase [Acidobacteriota bacterium]